MHDRLQGDPRSIRRLLAVALAPFVLGTVVGLVVLWPSHFHSHRVRNLGAPAQLVNATVSTVQEEACPAGAGRCTTIYLDVTSGPDHGRSAILPDVALGPGVPVLHGGDRIVVGRTVDPTSGHVDYYFADYQRRTPLTLLAVLFAAVVVGVARWRGFAAVIGLGVTALVLVRFLIPAILDGKSPLAAALVASAAILFVVIYAAHGVSARTTTALLGTLASLALTAVLAALFVAVTHVTGLASDETTSLQSAVGDVSLSGLILAGIVIGSLGVLNDVTVTQASAVWEVHGANPVLPRRELYRSGMRVGRDHIASTVYTLVLAYAGASLPLLILFSVAGQRLTNVLTGDLVAVEIVRTLVGSIGLVASVPFTTALAALVVGSTEPSQHVARTTRSPTEGPGHDVEIFNA